MRTSTPRRILLSALTAAALFASAGCAAAAPPAETAPESVTTVVTDPTLLTHFDLTGGQLPENIIAAADGGVLMTFAASRQIAHVTTTGETSILATLPASADASARTPVLGFPLATGIARDGATIYALLATGAADTTGVWRIEEGAEPTRIAELPGTGLPNGLALDTASDTLFAADSVTGAIFRIPTSGGEATVWSQATELRTTGFLGVNGLKIKDGAVYASNLDLGTLLRIPLEKDGTAGDIETIATDLVGIDDFDFTGNGDEIVATIDPDSEVVLVQESGAHTVVLTAKDGLSNPTAALVSDGRLYIPSAAYVTQQNPNLLVATIVSK